MKFPILCVHQSISFSICNYFLFPFLVNSLLHGTSVEAIMVAKLELCGALWASVENTLCILCEREIDLKDLVRAQHKMTKHLG